MIQAVEAVVDVKGQVRLLGPINLPEPRRAIVTILDVPVRAADETALLSEAALADWNSPEEDAWAHLQPET